MAFYYVLWWSKKNLFSVFFCLQYFLGVSVCMHVSVHMYVQEHLHMHLYARGG